MKGRERGEGRRRSRRRKGRRKEGRMEKTETDPEPPHHLHKPPRKHQCATQSVPVPSGSEALTRHPPHDPRSHSCACTRASCHCLAEIAPPGQGEEEEQADRRLRREVMAVDLRRLRRGAEVDEGEEREECGREGVGRCGRGGRVERVGRCRGWRGGLRRRNGVSDSRCPKEGGWRRMVAVDSSREKIADAEGMGMWTRAQSNTKEC